jgi:hypothetical protein
MVIKLNIEIWEIGRGGTNGSMGKGVDEWGKQCGDFWVL